MAIGDDPQQAGGCGDGQGGRAHHLVGDASVDLEARVLHAKPGSDGECGRRVAAGEGGVVRLVRARAPDGFFRHAREHPIDGQRLCVDERELQSDVALVPTQPGHQARLHHDRVDWQPGVAEIAGGRRSRAPPRRACAQGAPRVGVEEDRLVPAWGRGRLQQEFQEDDARAEAGHHAGLHRADLVPARWPALVEGLLFGGARGARGDDDRAHSVDHEISGHRAAPGQETCQFCSSRTRVVLLDCAQTFRTQRSNRLIPQLANRLASFLGWAGAVGLCCPRCPDFRPRRR